MSVMTSGCIVGAFGSQFDLHSKHINEMARLGIPTHALDEPDPIRAGYVHFDNGSFEFDQHHQIEGGVPAYLFLVRNRWGEANDIVAWSPYLNQLATWLNRAWALGEETIYDPRLSDHGGLFVWRSPIGWLKVNREGICLVRPPAAAHYLDAAGPLIAEDAAHGVELDRLLTRRAPRILIPSRSIKKAA